MRREILILISFMIIIFTILSSFSVIGLNTSKSSKTNQIGRIYGCVESIGKCTSIPVPDKKIACGRNLRNYEIAITDNYGDFEFENLSYSDRGTFYYVWVVPGQGAIRPYIQIVLLNRNNPEEFVYYLISIWIQFEIYGFAHHYYIQK